MKVFLTRSTGSPVSVPYEPEQHSSDGMNHGYFNLKLHPGDINKIPEIKGVQELRNLLAMLNGRDSVFQTLGCDKTFAPSENPDYKRRMNSYVDVVFEVLDWNLSTKNFDGLYTKFEDFAGSKGILPNSFGVEFSIGDTIFNQHGRLSGFHVTIWIFGYGKNDADARRQRAKSVNIVHEFFQKEIATFPGDRYTTAQTVNIEKADSDASGLTSTATPQGDCVKLIVSNPRTYDLPYVAGPPNTFAYVDLRSDPSRLDTVPELVKEPLLKPLVSVLNHASGPFMSHGCAVASRKPESRGISIPIPERAVNALHWYTSYVTFSFWLFGDNGPEPYTGIYDAFPVLSGDWMVCFELQPTYFCTLLEREQGMKYGETNGIACVLWTSGWGDTGRHAHDHWRSSVQALVDFFNQYRPVVSSSEGRTTVSQHMFNRGPTSGV